MRGTTFAGVFAVAVMAAASPAAGATYYTAPDADGAFPCAKADPCPIELAVDQGGDGDLVRILPGRYELAEALDIPTAGKFRGVRGRPAKLVSENGPAIWVVSGAPTVSDLVLRSPNQAILAGFSTAVFERLRAFGAQDTQGTCTLPTAPGVLRDTLCVNEGDGPAITSSVSSGGTYTEDFRLVNVTGVARADASGEANGLYANYVSGNPAAVMDVEITVKNTILRGGGGTADVEGETSGPGAETLVIDIVRSSYESTSTGANTSITGPGTDPGNLTERPRFVDADGGDYRQRRNSPTIDAGRGDPLLGTFDFEGDPRISGRRVDIGADEFTGN